MSKAIFRWGCREPHHERGRPFRSLCAQVKLSDLVVVSPSLTFSILIAAGEAPGWTGVSGLPERGFDPHLSPTILRIMRATLKKPWRSPAGKLYPSGTMFVKSRGVYTLPWVKAEWFDFDIPGKEHGMVLIPDSVFGSSATKRK